MPNYYLVEEKYLSPPQAHGNGLPANSVRIGFIDFLRELQQETFSFTQYDGLRVEGLEDVLIASRPETEKMALHIRHILQKSASDLDRKLCANVQIVIRNKMVRGEVLWIEHPAEKRLPVHFIFGSPIAEHIGSSPYYKTAFNLSSGH